MCEYVLCECVYVCVCVHMYVYVHVYFVCICVCICMCVMTDVHMLRWAYGDQRHSLHSLWCQESSSGLADNFTYWTFLLSHPLFSTGNLRLLSFMATNDSCVKLFIVSNQIRNQLKFTISQSSWRTGNTVTRRCPSPWSQISGWNCSTIKKHRPRQPWECSWGWKCGSARKCFSSKHEFRFPTLS